MNRALASTMASLAAALLLALPLGRTAAAQSATVMTDQADYAPGSIVTITGSGWQPGETVTLNFVESPLIDTHPDLYATADNTGNIFNNQFSPDAHDVDVTFTLTATGGTSGLQAQTTFTDGAVTSAIITIKKSDCLTSQTSFNQGDTICASVAEVKSGANSTSYHIQWYAPGATVGTTAPTRDTTKTVTATETDTDSFITSGATPTGTWTVVTCLNSGTCTAGNVLDTKTFTLAGPASKLVFTSMAVTVTVGVCSTALTVQSQDSAGNPSNVTGTETLSPSGPAGVSLYIDNTCTTAVTGSNLTIATGTNIASFYFKDTTAGSPTITVTGTGAFTTGTGANAATQTETVNAAAARRGQTIVAELIRQDRPPHLWSRHEDH
jgi:hypothetical protein